MTTEPVSLTPRGILLLFLPVTLLGCQGEDSFPADRLPPDPSGPATLVDEWVDMWNSYDLDQVEELFLSDERLSYFSSEREGAIRGMEELLEHHRGFGFVPGGKDQPNRLWVQDLQVHLFMDTAVLTGIWFFQAEDSAWPQRGPVTFVCLQESEEWRFVHMTFSEYLPPDTL